MYSLDMEQNACLEHLPLGLETLEFQSVNWQSCSQARGDNWISIHVSLAIQTLVITHKIEI